jgi:hypothetical protein
MFQGRFSLKSGLWPLVVLWLAVHAALLALILSVKFLTVKITALLLMAAALVWLVTGRKNRPSLPAPSGMV